MGVILLLKNSAFKVLIKETENERLEFELQAELFKGCINMAKTV